MRAQAREDGLAVQLGVLQVQFDDLQAELIRLQSIPQGEVGRGLPGYTPSCFCRGGVFSNSVRQNALRVTPLRDSEFWGEWPCYPGLCGDG